MQKVRAQMASSGREYEAMPKQQMFNLQLEVVLPVGVKEIRI